MVITREPSTYQLLGHIVLIHPHPHHHCLLNIYLGMYSTYTSYLKFHKQKFKRPITGKKWSLYCNPGLSTERYQPWFSRFGKAQCCHRKLITFRFNLLIITIAKTRHSVKLSNFMRSLLQVDYLWKQGKRHNRIRVSAEQS